MKHGPFKDDLHLIYPIINIVILCSYVSLPEGKKITSLRMIPTMAYIATYSTALESKYATWPKDTKEQNHFFSTSPSIWHIF